MGILQKSNVCSFPGSARDLNRDYETGRRRRYGIMDKKNVLFSIKVNTDKLHTQMERVNVAMKDVAQALSDLVDEVEALNKIAIPLHLDNVTDDNEDNLYKEPFEISPYDVPDEFATEDEPAKYYKDSFDFGAAIEYTPFGSIDDIEGI
jgi:hypothetical protein